MIAQRVTARVFLSVGGLPQIASLWCLLERSLLSCFGHGHLFHGSCRGVWWSYGFAVGPIEWGCKLVSAHTRCACSQVFTSGAAYNAQCDSDAVQRWDSAAVVCRKPPIIML